MILVILLVWLAGAYSTPTPVNYYTAEDLADAIYYVEGGSNTKFPYGVMRRYKTTTPRQACLKTIRSAYRRWNKKGDFIIFLGQTYCPPKAHPKNRYWAGNVRAIIKRNRDHKNVR